MRLLFEGGSHLGGGEAKEQGSPVAIATFPWKAKTRACINRIVLVPVIQQLGAIGIVPRWLFCVIENSALGGSAEPRSATLLITRADDKAGEQR